MLGSWHRVVIQDVIPQVDGGRFPAKRIVGDRVEIAATVFTDGHERVACVVSHRGPGAAARSEAPMTPGYEDRWTASLRVPRVGLHRFRVEGWVDPFETWRISLRRWLAAGQDVRVQLLEGRRLVAEAAARARGRDADDLLRRSGRLTPRAALSERLAVLMARHPDRSDAVVSPELAIMVQPARARFSAWYELFPRSAAAEPGRHGTFADVEARLPYVRRLGFDTLYLPPIHPIGRTHRKGPNNSLSGGPDDPGSPWAIGSEEGGHRAVNPLLGTLADFRRLVRRARAAGIEVALDLAFQCSPDHPYVREHPGWFLRRPDGTIQPAENPPKSYPDVYPLDFACADWPALWQELCGVTLHWVAQGVKTFRVDNPHTKPLAFWEWMLAEVRARHPDVIFLSEAFTRRPVMYRLAKLGFDQSYTYFTWRNSAWDLREYMSELTRSPVADFFRPSLWPNTPDILNAYLREGQVPASAVRLLLAATLGASYGIYGPPFELAEHEPVAEGSEEYLDSEKYQLRSWDLGRPGLQELIARVNAARRAHPALQQDHTLRFCQTDNEQLIAYTKTAPRGGDTILVIANLDWRHPQSGWVRVPVGGPVAYVVQDLLDGSTFRWHGEWNYVEVNPSRAPGHLFSVGATLVHAA